MQVSSARDTDGHTQYLILYSMVKHNLLNIVLSSDSIVQPFAVKEGTTLCGPYAQPFVVLTRNPLWSLCATLCG